MSSTTSTRAVVTLQPSTQEDAYAYIAAIRLASSVRNRMDAEKADEVSGDMAINADSWGRYHPNLPPPPPAASTTPGGRKPFPILNQTSSAHFASNATRPDTVQPGAIVPSSNHTMNKAENPNGATLEALKQHHGDFPPPEPPVGSTQGDERIHRRRFQRPVKITPTGTVSGPIAIETSHGPVIVPDNTTHDSTEAPPGESTSRRTGNIPIHLDQGPLPFKLNVPGGIPAQCQLYATNADANLTFTVCPVTKRNNSPTHDLESRPLHPRDASNSHILAIRNTPTCEAPNSFKQRLACGRYDGLFALAFFILFAMVCVAWLRICEPKIRQLDEEIRGAAWPRSLNVSTKSSEAKLRRKARKAHKKNHGLDEKLGAQQYEGVAWRSASYRAARTKVEGTVEHDARPIGVLPGMAAVEPVCQF